MKVRRRVSIISLFLSGIVFSFLVSTFLIIVLAIISIKKLDNILSTNISKDLYTRKADTLLEFTRRKANDYNNLLREAMLFSELLHTQTQTAKDFYSFYKAQDPSLLLLASMTYEPDKRIFFNNPKENPRIFYWGEGEPTRDSYFKIRGMLALELLMKALVQGFSEGQSPYFAAFIANEKEHILIDYFYKPDVGLNIAPPSREVFEQYYSKYAISENGWTEVYKDITGYFLVTTYKKILDEEGKVIGRTGIDFSVDYIIEDLKRFHIEVFHSESSAHNEPYSQENCAINNESFSFVLNMDNGAIIACQSSDLPKMGLKPKQSEYMDYQAILDIKITDSKNEQIQRLFKELQNCEDKFLSFFLNGEEFILVFSKIHASNWGLCSVVPVNEIMTSIHSAKRYMGQSFILLSASLIMMGIIYIILCFSALVFLFRKMLVSPISELLSGVKKLKEGEFGAKINMAGAKEIYDMTASFNFLSGKLSRYSLEVESKTSSRQYIEQEVSIAKKIQSAVLPHFDLTEFNSLKIDLYGKIISSDIISSVFYDYFPVSREKIAFLVGEVSGKSIPAAFYMMMAKTLLKDACMKYPDSPADVLDEVNRILCEKNMDMFMSIALVFYDQKSSKISYSFGGFASIFGRLPNGNIEEFSGKRSPVLGLIKDALYVYEIKQITPETLLLLFTRGVLDSINAKGEPYNIDMAIKKISSETNLSAHEISEILSEDIKTFADVSKEDKCMLFFRAKSSINGQQTTNS